MALTIALVVGISRYRSREIDSLPAAQIDAIHFARALNHWGVTETTLLINEEATTHCLEDWFKSLSQKREEYKLVFYFCGHGERETGAIPNSHLLFYDGEVHLDSLINRFCGLKSNESYIFIDACSLRINSLLNPKLEEELKGRIVSHKSFFCLLSSGIEQSFENHQYGYFTDALLKTLAKTRQIEPDCTQFFALICKTLKENDLPLPEMYNIGSEKISFLPPMQPLFNCDGMLYRSEMVGKIEDALILNRGKIGVLLGEKGSGKTSLCKFLSKTQPKTYYIMIPHSVPLLDALPFDLRNEEFAGSLILIDQAETINSEQLSRLIREVKVSLTQFLLISDRSFQRDDLFEIKMEPLSPEEGKHFMLPFSHSEKETRLIHLASRGNPSKMQQVAYLLNRSEGLTNLAEKDEILKTISAIYGCGCYISKELFAKIFSLSLASLKFLEELGLISWDGEAWTPHPIFYEIAESESLSIDRKASLKYWYRQMRKTPDSMRAAANLITTVKCFEYEKKADPYLKMAFQALSKETKEHLESFIEGTQIFEAVPFVTEASTLLAEILIDLKRFDLAHALRQAGPKRKQKIHLIWGSCLLIALLAFGFYYPFCSPRTSYVNVKRIHPDFVGREGYLNEIKRISTNWKKGPPVTVLWGEAGIGKSELAIAYANLNAKKYRLICWIDSETEESYAASFYDVAERIKISVDQEKDLVKKVHNFLEKDPSVQPWLLIFDNPSEKAEIPSKGKGSILITTRNRTPWQSYRCIEVAPFKKQEAIALFKKITNSSESAQIHSLVDELDSLPLTLNLAAHYIAETPEMNEEIYLSLLSENNVDLISSMPTDGRYPTPLLSSWNIAARELDKNHPETLQWLHFCSYLHPSGIPAVWVEKWLTDTQGETDPFKVKILSGNILRILVNQCLMRFEKNTHTLSLHNLKQDVMKRDRFVQKGIVDQVAQFLINCSQNIEKIYEGKINPHQRTNLREWEPHVAWFLNKHSSECSQEQIASLQNLLGNWRYLKGNYKSAQSFLEQSLKIRMDLYGEEHPQTIISMNNLAMILWENGQFSESKILFTRSLEASKKVFKEDHLDVIITLNNLGWVSWEMGEFQEAKALLNQSLSLSKKLDACDPDFLQVVNDFLLFLDDEAKRKNEKDKDKDIKRALFLRHAGLWIAEVEGNPTKSLSYFEQSLELLKQTLPVEDPRVAIAYGSVGISLNRADRSDEGQHYLAKALELQKKVLGDEHPETAKSYANLAISLFNLGKGEQALEYHLKALDIRKKTLGELHPVTAKSYSGTGNTLILLEKYEEALFYNNTALEIRRKTLGENHSETAQSYSRLGANLGKLGRHHEALEYNLKALEILNKIFNERHYLTAKAHKALEVCYRDLGLLQESLYHAKRAEEIRKLLW